ncbi:MAG TPA: septation regulator SpoVG [Candidatus Avilachnospira avicola]|nr:septation regulator SpoVG [Candidatus Avilachnospira avicola]
MEITDVRVRKIDKEGRLKGMASVTFDDLFVVHDIKIVDGDHGLFIAMPSRRSKEGGYRDIAHPINPDMRQLLQDLILAEFEKI